IAIGSAGLLIALSITHGFKSKIQNKVLGFAPDITISKFSNDPITRTDTLTAFLKQYSAISKIQPVVSGQSMLQSSKQVTGAFFTGIPAEDGVTQLINYIVEGRYDLSVDSTGLPGAVIGGDMANELQVKIGDILTAYTVEGIPSPFGSPAIQQFRLSGIYQTGIGRFDEGLVITSQKYARQLFAMPPLYSSKIEVEVRNKKQIKSFGQILSASLPVPYFSLNIYQKYKSIFTWIKLQEQTIPFVIGVMIIVAAFNLIGTILM